MTIDLEQLPEPQLGHPQQLMLLERVISSARLGPTELHHRLRPILREVARTRLAARGIALDDDPRSRALLGETLWEIVRAERPRPDDPSGPSPDLRGIAAMVDQLGRL